jgi:hypothetical protein
MRDSDVRRAVKSWLAAEYAFDDDTRIVEEMGVWSGSVRIDIAIINGSLSGYELKSDRDTLDRLPHQLALRAGSACLNRISASISGAPAEVRQPSGMAAG